ncbi:MAG TPA: tRNA guanosine(34) transglycosylase Tgt [Polyangiaceae bacterium]|nr:tRNA guanosine(34) transglycosylase Tgt [Polyangiaceae bacterium]
MTPRADGFAFRVLCTDGHARRSTLRTPHADVELPTFMPVGTQASVKALSPDEVASTGARIMLGNTYHLWLRPGEDVIAAHGGLRGFSRWPHAMLTDSGGFQAFSLGSGKSPQSKGPLVAPAEDGFTFTSHLDGSRRFLSPEIAVEVQGKLGADIQMQLDVCPPGDSPRDVVEAAVKQTTRWAKRALATPRPPRQALFGIVQGACFSDLRVAHAEELAAMDPGFDGLALGGFSVGEAKEKMVDTIAEVAHRLDAERPRYLMGVGTPEDLLVAVGLGVDMFDCVLPTRNARNGQALTRNGKLIIKNAKHARDDAPIDPECGCECCARGYSRSYLRHLYLAGEILVLRLLSLHNLHFYGELMAGARKAIEGQRYAEFARGALDRMKEGER